MNWSNVYFLAPVKIVIMHIIYVFCSPRSLHKPKHLYPKQYEDLFKAVIENNVEMAQPPVIKFKEEHHAWRDDDGEGNTLLHIASWRGDVQVARCIFNSIKARKLTSIQNKKGATPLAMAIISGQVLHKRRNL